MIANQIKRLNIYQDYEEYYHCGLIGLWYAKGVFLLMLS
ncbi:hypothetical protein BTJ45_03886 [Bacillus mycoides]|nr:hypothetical protein BTJ45_03886 [Bacillus mycoides]